MKASMLQNQFFFALLMLLLVHTCVSAAAYKWLTKTTVQEWPKDTVVETTTPQEALRGQKVYMANKRVVSRSMPWPVPCYIIGGYVGLAVAICMWLVRQARVV